MISLTKISTDSPPTKSVGAQFVSLLVAHKVIEVAFLDQLRSYPPLPSPQVLQLGKLYALSETSNAELRLRFYLIALSDPSSQAAKSIAPDAAKWVVGDDGSGVVKGRMKFCRPTFKAVYNVDQDLAISTFSRFKDNFHPIAKKLIEKVWIIFNVYNSCADPEADQSLGAGGR